VSAHLGGSHLAEHHRLPWSVLSRGDVVEIHGPPSCGKTHLIYLLLIICITPREHQSILVGGWDKAGIVFDMDGSFDITRFNRLLLGRLKRMFSSNIHAQTVAQRSLERLHIFRPSSSTQLATTLTQLGRYHAAHLSGVEIGLIAIDSINAYHWADRFIVEQVQTSSLTRKALPPLRILTALSSLRATHAPVIMMTSRDLQATIHGAPPSLISTHHITLSAHHVSRFQQGMPIATAKVEEKDHGRERVEIIASMQILKYSTVNDFSFHITGNEFEVAGW